MDFEREVVGPNDALADLAGHAASWKQVQRMGISIIFFFFMKSVLNGAVSNYVPKYNQMNKADQTSFLAALCSSVHAIVVSILCISLVVFPDHSIEVDRAYGVSDRANLAFSISVGYFVFDMLNCLKGADTNWGFVFHHGACILCYMFVQYPFLPYYAIRFLLYELSTPFLNLRTILLQLGHKGTPLCNAAEKCFGYTFLVVRILMGIPLSTMAMFDAYDLVQAGRHHSLAIVCYFIFANIGLNALNLHWLRILLRKGKKASANKSKSE